MSIPSEVKKRLSDYFEVSDFVDYVGVTVDDILLYFEEDVEDCLDDLLELMGDKND